VYLVSFTPQNGCAILRGPRSFTPKTHLVRPWGSELRNAGVSRFFHPTKWLRNFAGATIFHPKNSPCSSLGAPISVSLVYLVPLARSRYCASPEASIMRLKAAPSLGLGLSFAVTPKTALSSILNSQLREAPNSC